jgi:hypothetical protein
MHLYVSRTIPATDVRCAVSSLRPLAMETGNHLCLTQAWLQRAIQAGRGKAATYHIRDGRMIPKPAK